MSILRLPKRYHPDFGVPNKQPQGQVKINHRNLVMAYLASNPEINLFDNQGVVNSAAVSRAIDANGKAANKTSNSTTGIEFVNKKVFPQGSQNRTLVLVHKRRFSETDGALFTQAFGTGGDTGRRWTVRYLSNAIRIEIQGGGHTSTLTPPLNELSFTAVGLDGTQMGDHFVYVNGEYQTVAASSTGVNTGVDRAELLANSGLSRAGARDNIYLALMFNKALSKAELDSLYRDPYQILKPKTEAYYFTGSGGVISSPLIVQSISQSQTLSQPILTTSSISLLVQGLAQTNSISAPSLTQHNSLLVGGVNQTQSLEAPALTQAHILLTNKIDQAQTSGNVSLIQAHTLAVDNNSQAQTTSAPNLLQHNILSVDSTKQTAALSGAFLAVAGSLAVSGIGQNNTIQNPSLVQHSQLIADALSQGQSLEVTSLAQVSGLIVQALDQAQSASQSTLNQHNVLSVQDLLQTAGIDESVLSVLGQLAPSGLTQAQLVEAAILAQHHTLSVQGVSQSIDLSNSLLDISAALSVLGVNQAQGLENLNLTSTGVLSVDSLTQQQLADLVRFGGAVIGYLRGELVISCLVNGKVETFNLVNGNFETIH